MITESTSVKRHELVQCEGLSCYVSKSGHGDELIHDSARNQPHQESVPPETAIFLLGDNISLVGVQQFLNPHGSSGRELEIA